MSSLLKLYIVINLLCLLMAGCALNLGQRLQKPVSLEQAEQFGTDYSIGKVVYSSLSKTYFIREKNSPYIHLIFNGQEINKIGGLGFTESSFQKLTDIGVFTDGTFYGLDSFAKKLRHFDEKGKWLADFDLSFASEPYLFALNSNNLLIVYDKSQRELIHVSGLAGTENFRFGKFQLHNVQEIAISGDYLFVYQNDPSETAIFSILGQYLETRAGKVIADVHGNYYSLNTHSVKMPGNKDTAFSTEPYSNLFYATPDLLTNTENSIQRWRILYENQP